jgi:hypothetical protein
VNGERPVRAAATRTLAYPHSEPPRLTDRHGGQLPGLPSQLHRDLVALPGPRGQRPVHFAATGVGVSAETPMLAIVTEQHADATMPPDR